MLKYLILAAATLACTSSSLAINVRVFHPGDNRDLVIEGDGDWNSISIVGLARNRVRIQGHKTGPFGVYPTLINGSLAPLDITVSDDVSISMGGGNDRVDINDLELTGFNHNDLRIVMGSGNDELLTDSVSVSRTVAIDMGSGHDDLYAGGIDARRLDVLAGSGNDYINVYYCGMFELNAFGGDGNDTFYVVGNGAFDIVVSLDAGNDGLTLIRNVAEVVDLFGGEGSDGLALSTMFWDVNTFETVPNVAGFEGVRG